MLLGEFVSAQGALRNSLPPSCNLIYLLDNPESSRDSIVDGDF
jgi:hypothetical protein